MEHYLDVLARENKELVLPKIVDSFESVLSKDLSPQDYHGSLEFVSSSGLKEIAKNSPRHFINMLCEQQFGKTEEEPEHFRFGRIAHMMLLEPSKFRENYIAMPDFGDMRSKINREAKEAWVKDQPANAILLNQKEMSDLTRMAGSILSNPIAKKILSEGMVEASLFFRDKDTGILCRSRPDIFQIGGYVVDFKTTQDSSPGVFSNSIRSYRYDLQMAFYYDAVKLVTGKEPEAAVIIACDKKAPFDTGIYMLDDDALETGRQWYKQALRILKVCIEKKKWPGRQARAQMISLPRASSFESFPEFSFD
jgi:exodeoxyribonuclease VIII